MARFQSDLRIYCINDVYKPERFSQFRSFSKIAEAGLSGIAKTVFAGDVLGGSLFAAVHSGESMIHVMNHLGVDYSLMGNHEFDYGSERLAELMDKSNFCWLGSNVRNVSDRKLFHTTKDFDIFEVSSTSSPHPNPTRVGIFGVCTDMTPVLSDPGENVVFENAVEHCRRCVSSLKSAGCDFIIAVTHLDLQSDYEVARLKDIDVVIGGHDHRTVFEPQTDSSMVIKCGQDLDQLGILDLTFHRGSDNTFSYLSNFEFVSITSEVNDQEIEDVIGHWRSLAASSEAAVTPICCVEDRQISTLTSSLRHTETAFACLIAECIKYSYREQNCQLGIINGGFIRRDRVYKVGSVLTSADLKEELPFPRFPVLLRMKGSDIKLALEQMISRCPDPVGCFPHLSDEWTAEYDLDRVPMDRVHSIRYKGTPMDLEEHYLVGVTDFYASKGGDGVDAYMGKEVVANHERTVCDCALEYFKLKQVISGRLPLRFTPSPNVR